MIDQCFYLDQIVIWTAADLDGMVTNLDSPLRNCKNFDKIGTFYKLKLWRKWAIFGFAFMVRLDVCINLGREIFSVL